MDEILEYFSFNIKRQIELFIQNNTKSNIVSCIEEIRLRVNKKITLKVACEIIFLDYIVTSKDIRETFEKICENSVYSYKKEICEGFITIKGGNRVGITGNCIIEDEKIININYISSLNFRIAREKIGCSKEIIKDIVSENSIYNTMIVSPPGAGKTTMLRDLIKNLSDTYKKTIGVVDERGEIAAMYRGIAQNDIGDLTDVITNISKDKGMNILIRSMAPQIIACDEIGKKEDIDAINYAICSGAKGIFTSHGKSFEEINLNCNIKNLLEKHIIERIFFLDDKVKGKIKEKYFLDVKNRQYVKIS